MNSNSNIQFSRKSYFIIQMLVVRPLTNETKQIKKNLIQFKHFFSWQGPNSILDGQMCGAAFKSLETVENKLHKSPDVAKPNSLHIFHIPAAPVSWSHCFWNVFWWNTQPERLLRRLGLAGQVILSQRMYAWYNGKSNTPLNSPMWWETKALWVIFFPPSLLSKSVDSSTSESQLLCHLL